jgi:hypothetical protein
LSFVGVRDNPCLNVGPEAATINAALAAVCGIGPRDETEAMLRCW